MNKKWILAMLTVAILMSLGSIGCEKKQATPESTAAEAVEQAPQAAPVEHPDAAKPAETPAAEKPKDHPAH